MKGFFKFAVAVSAIFGVIISVLAAFDCISNKNRIKGDYLECDNVDNGL